jgi:amino acid transporter
MARRRAVPSAALPRAILISLGLSTLLYALVTAVTILAIPHEELAASSAPLLLVAEEAAWFSSDLFAAIALIAVANGVLIELVMLGRLLYGMTRRGWLPSMARRGPSPSAHADSGHPLRRRGGVCPDRRGAVPAPCRRHQHDHAAESFALVNLALWRLQRRQPRDAGFRVPQFIPPMAAVANLALAVAQFLD